MRDRREHFAALVAGIFDGEGCVAGGCIAGIAVGVFPFLCSENSVSMVWKNTGSRLTDLEGNLHSGRDYNSNKSWRWQRTLSNIRGTSFSHAAWASSSLVAGRRDEDLVSSIR
jgi:hypothetical protein